MLRRTQFIRQSPGLKRSGFKNFRRKSFRLGTRTYSTFRESAEADAPRRRLLPLGKKGRDWIAVRRRLSAEFAATGIISCELGYESCWGANALGFAHGRKRRHLRGDELETLTILACGPCHDRIEYLPPDEMLAIVESVIERREVTA